MFSADPHISLTGGESIGKNRENEGTRGQQRRDQPGQVRLREFTRPDPAIVRLPNGNGSRQQHFTLGAQKFRGVFLAPVREENALRAPQGRAGSDYLRVKIGCMREDRGKLV